jgi:phage-related protein
LEKAISEKYGEVATINPKSLWNEEKEKGYLEQSKEKLKKDARNDVQSENIDLNGILIPKKLINSVQSRKCQYCETYSFNREDDVYFSKYDTCHKCYVKYIEDREERWKNGWRPDKTEQK